jgi:hypothetical protein
MILDITTQIVLAELRQVCEANLHINCRLSNGSKFLYVAVAITVLHKGLTPVRVHSYFMMLRSKNTNSHRKEKINYKTKIMTTLPENEGLRSKLTFAK